MRTLYVFEGVDGTGKSELSRRFADHLRSEGVDCVHLAFPGRVKGTLGKHIYDLHHDPEKYDVRSMHPVAKQALHVAAHIDAIENTIRPALAAGKTVVLDRFWWSTIVYGQVDGADKNVLDALLTLELAAWQQIKPTATFMVRRKVPLRKEPAEKWARWCAAYENIALEQRACHPVVTIDNDGSIDDAMRSLVDSTPYSHAKKARTPDIQVPPSPAQPSVVYETYWRFAVERQAVFFRRFNGEPYPWTHDPILREYKFTNAYRAADRVSQHLIRNIIYEGDDNIEEVFFRTLVFKLFNKIETWRLLCDSLSGIRFADYDFRRYDDILSRALTTKKTIYSAAYIMPSGAKTFGTRRKHQAHLKLLERMMDDEVPLRLANMSTMLDAFRLLLSYPLLGDFLAYQYITDLNYSTVTNFQETEFVVPGPGARGGIRKCFESLGGYTEADIIRLVMERQEHEFNRLELDFQSLWGRPLQLIDCQNLFCEVDKYSRVAHPEVLDLSGRTRIKQKFRSNPTPVDYWFPPKWGVNEHIERNRVPRL